MHEIHQWSDIADDFNHALIVGNGGSMALSSNFAYDNLYEFGLKNDHIKLGVKEIFDEFFGKTKAKDFERMLYRLWQADFVAKKLTGASTPEIRQAYLSVRQALIETVRGVHPEASSLEGLDEIGSYLRNFRHVFALNYDLIVYWAYINAHKLERNCVVDGFSDQKFTEDIDGFYEKYSNSTLVMYPHGNLALYQTAVKKVEKKVHRNSSASLLGAISDKWRKGVVPLFVSEAKSDQKRAAIARSPYLSTVNNHVLPGSGPSVTIYGWSMSKQDVHILHSLKIGEYNRAAVSIRPSVDDSDKMDLTVEQLKNHAGIDDVLFFDAQSPGCWNNE